MKRLFNIFAIFTFIFATAFSAKKDFIATGEGYLGDIKVKVSFENNYLTGVEVVENKESDFTQKAMEVIIQDVIETQSTEVDSVGGATYTSEGLKSAITSAITASKIKLVKKDKKVVTFKDSKTDIVIIGGGGAGLTAAIAAKEQGANVILLEKMPILGGNTNYATGGLNAANTSVQKAKGVEDSETLFIEDTMKGGKNSNDRILVEKMSNYSKEIVDWLSDRGADLSDLGRMGGQSVNRTHRPAGGKAIGPDVVSALSKKANDLKLDIRLNQEATEILMDAKGIKGVKVSTKSGETYIINSGAVVVTTGGFGANPEMIISNVPALKGFGTTNHKGALGEGITMLKKLNADMIDLDQIQTHPTVVPADSTMITEAVRGNGAILINRDAKRFVNELETRDVVSKAELNQKQGTAYLIFDHDVRLSLKAIEKYYEKGLLTVGATLDELAKKLNVPAPELAKTMKNYEKIVTNKNDTEFGRKDLPRPLNVGPFYAVEVGPAVHHTMGGVAINSETEVLSKGKVIPGLFAAGEITGGIHGQNRLGGNAMSDITIFGKIAGDNAAKYIKIKK
ncbi:MAG: flavocytochrome c [Fusobacteriaceae bacterium]